MALSRGWEFVWSGDGEANAEIVAGALRSAGIAARTTVTPPGYTADGSVISSSATIAVRRKDAVRARKVLEGNGEGHNLLEHGSENGLTANQRATLWIAATGLLALIAAGLFLDLANG